MLSSVFILLNDLTFDQASVAISHLLVASPLVSRMLHVAPAVRLDGYPMPGGRPGYVVDVQADLLDQLKTRIAVPLIPEHLASKPVTGLNPVFHIAGEPHVMLTQASAEAVPLVVKIVAASNRVRIRLVVMAFLRFLSRYPGVCARITV